MKNSLAVMDECVDHLTRLDIPDPNCAITRAGDDHLLVVLETEDGASVAGEDALVLLQSLPVPHLDRVVPEPAHNLRVVILQTVDTFTVLAPTVDPLQVVLTAPPVVLDSLTVNHRQWSVQKAVWLNLHRYL